ncbi:BQ2448_7569 [Microbotryum intermedium]|uniref:tRNA (guanine(26)-N(2))-dimethyltransferase n=1 Tax=Microbotryum intermedium TaxID=269621 RepID=A0A238FL88_9BASI|nr:BQ2448_7569 [Microbotryum intermedium]
MLVRRSIASHISTIGSVHTPKCSPTLARAASLSTSTWTVRNPDAGTPSRTTTTTTTTTRSTRTTTRRISSASPHLYSIMSADQPTLHDSDVYQATDEPQDDDRSPTIAASASASGQFIPLERGHQPLNPPSSSCDMQPQDVPQGFVLHRESTTSILFAIPAATTTTAPASTLTASTSTSSTTGAPVAPVFLNPVQEYNRDLSVVAIRTWSEMRQLEKQKYWEVGVRNKWAKKNRPRSDKREEGNEGERDAEEGDRKKHKMSDGTARAVDPSTEPEASTSADHRPIKEFRIANYPTFKFTLLEALSATGLRAIRYAKEIPLLKYVVANDLSSSAVEDIERNIAWNGLKPPQPEPTSTESPPAASTEKGKHEGDKLGKVRANHDDACNLMYRHRSESTRFDCVDLDPYGSAVPFLDAAVGAVADGGLLCITCTDMGVLAGHNYPEKAFTHYGGVCVNTEYSHEVALRLVLHSIATTAARYGRYIEPLLSLSIDFYVRLFIRVNTGPKEVKALPSKTSLLYYCHHCQTPHFQPMGRTADKIGKSGAVNTTYHAPSGPPPGVGESCGQCGGKFSVSDPSLLGRISRSALTLDKTWFYQQIGGPMWSAPIHSQSFITAMLEQLEAHPTDFSTATRIQGMLTIAKSEIPEGPLYFSPTKVCGFFHCQSPPMNLFASALLNAGYQVSRSHAFPGSIKTSAPRDFVFDVMREWIKSNPVNMKNVKDGSPAKKLLAREQKYVLFLFLFSSGFPHRGDWGLNLLKHHRYMVNLTPHPDVAKHMLSNLKLVKYQMNPQANWGPAKAAVKGKKE